MKKSLVETTISKCQCPTCGEIVDTTFGDSPNVGDITICVECGGFSKLDSNLKLQILEENEEKDILESELEVGGKTLTARELREMVKTMKIKRRKLN